MKLTKETQITVLSYCMATILVLAIPATLSILCHILGV